MNTESHRNGCHNRSPLRGHSLMSLDWREGHPPKAVYINLPHRMAKTCQYTLSELGKQDPGCAGCKHRKVDQ